VDFYINLKCKKKYLFCQTQGPTSHCQQLPFISNAKTTNIVLCVRIHNKTNERPTDLEKSIAGIELKHNTANAPYVARLRPTYVYHTHITSRSCITAVSRGTINN